MYISASLPPKVIELNIFYNSPMKRRVYMLHPSLSNVYEGRDFVAANDNYVVTPVFNLREWRLQLLVFYRKGTNSRMWHSIITLDDPPHHLTSLHFLCSTYCNTLFSRNVIRADLHEIQGVNFVVDTTERNHNIFNRIENREIQATLSILNIHDRRTIETTHFYFKVVSLDDMSTYYVAPDPSQFSYYGYGDPTYFHSISKFYSGPDLKFTLDFKNPDINGYLLLPNVTQVYEVDPLIRVLDVEDTCMRSLFHTFVDPFTLEEVITFYCIQRSSIEEHTLKKGGTIVCDDEANLMITHEWRRVHHFPRANFTHYVFYDNPAEMFEVSRLVILHENWERNIFELHFFNAGNQLSWRMRDILDLGSRRPRPNEPLYGSDIDGLYFIVDYSERLIYCYLADFARDNENPFTPGPQRFGQSGIFQTIRTYGVINNIKHCCQEYIFVSYDESKIVGLFKIFKDTDPKTKLNNLSIELSRNFIYTKEIIYLNINERGHMLLFSGKNTIEHLLVQSLHTIALQRILPFFKYAKFMEFLFDSRKETVVYAHQGDLFFVVMVHMDDKNDERLF